MFVFMYGHRTSTLGHSIHMMLYNWIRKREKNIDLTDTGFIILAFNFVENGAQNKTSNKIKHLYTYQYNLYNLYAISPYPPYEEFESCFP